MKGATRRPKREDFELPTGIADVRIPDLRRSFASGAVALESGHVGGATLDCFEEEPLPPDHPYRTHPKVLMTPHIASKGVVRMMAVQIADNIRRARESRTLIGLVDRAAAATSAAKDGTSAVARLSTVGWSCGGGACVRIR